MRHGLEIQIPNHKRYFQRMTGNLLNIIDHSKGKASKLLENKKEW